MNKISVAVLSLAVATFSSCSVIDTVSQKVNNFKSTKLHKTKNEKPVDEGKTKVIINTISTPGDTIIQKTEINYTHGYNADLDGEWTVIGAYGKPFNMEEMPFLTFDTAENMLYGNTGCNVINGVILHGNNNYIRFDNVLTSMRACENSTTERLINKAVNEAASYSIHKSGGATLLNIKNAKGTTIMQLRRHNLDALNGTWQIEEINDKKISNPNMRVVIDIPEEKLHGNSGCNTINGAVIFDRTKINAIQFSRIITTRATCPDQDQEIALLVALEEVVAYRIKSSNEVAFYNSENNRVLVIRRVETK